MKNLLKTFIAALATVAIASCGGGGGDKGDSPFDDGPNGGVPTASNLSLTLSSSSIFNNGAATVTATATATTSAGQALDGIPVTFTVDNGATFTVASSPLTTGTDGRAVATVGIGADKSNRTVTVTARSGGLTATQQFAVSGSKLTSAPSATIVTPGSTDNRVEFRLVDANDAAISGQRVTVTAGGATPVEGTTNTNGVFAFTYTAPAATGALDIVATSGGVQVTQTIQVQSSSTAINPACAAAQRPSSCISSGSISANPSVVATNDATTNNRTEIRALFVGANNAPIRNVRVRFDLNGDANSIGGTFSTGSNVVYSDSNGVATTAYVPGTRSSPTNGVTIRACYSGDDFATGCPNQALTTITVASDPLSVSIGSNATIIVGPSGLTYRRQFVVLVVDASGRAKANVDIVPSLDLPVYYKGRYVRGANWFKGYTTVVNNTTVVVQSDMDTDQGCINEDLNRNGVLDVGDDVNGNGVLDPRKSDATITVVGSNKTDANGAVTLQVEYPQNVGSWLQIRILVSATGVAGTEGRAFWTEVLPVPIDAITAAAAPPFIVSPYGQRFRDDANRVPEAVDASGNSTYVKTDPCKHPD